MSFGSKKLSLGGGRSGSVPWCGSGQLAVLCVWFTEGNLNSHY